MIAPAKTIELDGWPSLGELSERLALPEVEMQVVVASGSLIRGWGGTDSDFDVYIFTHSPLDTNFFDDAHMVRLSKPNVPVGGYQRSGRDCDIESWTFSQIADVIAKVSDHEALRSSSTLEGLSHFEMDLLEKVSYGIPLKGADEFRRIQESINDSAYSDLLIRQALDIADIHLLEALGLLDINDFNSAMLAVKVAFANTCDALTYSLGSFGLSPKWRANRIRDVASPLLSLERFVEFESMATYSSADPSQWVLEVVDLCREVSEHIPVRAWGSE